MQLTLKQQQEIENSIWVVNTALKKQGLSNNEDMRQSAILYMCSCITRFDPTRNIKWTTFAYRNVYLFIKRTISKERKKASLIIKEDFDELANFIIADNRDYGDAVGLSDCIRTVCSSEEQIIVELKGQGFNNNEIAHKLHCSTSKINGCMKRIREKIGR